MLSTVWINNKTTLNLWTWSVCMCSKSLWFKSPIHNCDSLDLLTFICIRKPKPNNLYSKCLFQGSCSFWLVARPNQTDASRSTEKWYPLMEKIKTHKEEHSKVCNTCTLYWYYVKNYSLTFPWLFYLYFTHVHKCSITLAEHKSKTFHSLLEGVGGFSSFCFHSPLIQTNWTQVITFQISVPSSTQ